MPTFFGLENFRFREDFFKKYVAAPGTSAPAHKIYGKRIPVVYGTATVTGMRLWEEFHYYPFQVWAVVANTMLDGVNVNIDMNVGAFQHGFAFGPVDAIDGIIYEGRVYGVEQTPGTVIAQSCLGTFGSPPTYTPEFPPEFTLGDVTTAAEWTYLTGLAADVRIPFGHIACMRSEKLPLPNGVTGVGKVKAIIRGTTAFARNTAREDALADAWEVWDANPADVIVDLIENGIYGLGYPAGTVEVELGGNGLAGSSYTNYCQALGLWIALGIDEDVQVGEILGQILVATNSVGFWDGPKFKVIPKGDESVTGNGVTYTPVLTALVIDDVFIVKDGENPVLVRRSPLTEAFNVYPVEWSKDNVIRDVEISTTSSMDVVNAGLMGIRTAKPWPLPCIRSEAHALAVSKLLAHASVYERATYEFTVNPQAAARIQVGDVIALNHEMLGISDLLVRVTETDEDSRGQLKVFAKNWNTGATYERINMANPIYDLAAYVPDAPAGSAEVARWAISRSVDFPTDFGASNAVAGVAATASTVLTVRKNGTSVGTITFGAAGTVGAFSGTAWSVVADDVVTITNQATADATLAQIGITLTGERPA
jgi:hypothetical protein